MKWGVRTQQNAGRTEIATQSHYILQQLLAASIGWQNAHSGRGFSISVMDVIQSPPRSGFHTTKAPLQGIRANLTRISGYMQSKCVVYETQE
jgi:hypothetical protein